MWPAGFRIVENCIWICKCKPFISMGVGRVNFQWRTTHFSLQSLTVYVPKKRKPANKEANNYQGIGKKRLQKRKSLAIEKNPGMIWNRGEDFEKQQQNHDDILSPPSLKKHRLEEHPERPPLESKESKNAGFWAHYTKSAQGSSLRSPLLKRKVTVSSSFSFATGCVLKTELWNQHLGFTSHCELSECLRASKSPLSSLLIVLCQRKPSPQY